MVRVNVVVEGQTEETFVRDFLSPEFGQIGIFLTARCVETGKKNLKIHRGGMTSYEKAKRDINSWLSQDTDAYVTTMFDLYGLPNDFPGYDTALKALDRARFIENELKIDINNTRFIPYIQTHEFEALIFSDPGKVDDVIPDCNISTRLQAIKNQYTTPEFINDSYATAPSKRIIGLNSSYNKVLYGTRITRRIGLTKLESECEHFSNWLSSLRALNTTV